MASCTIGGPLFDACGRLLGINSFGSLSDGNDAEFVFAISNREIASFLRQSGVDFARTNVECKSPEQAQEEEARRTAEELARQETRERMTADARRAAITAARAQAEQAILSSQENHMADTANLQDFAVPCHVGAALMLAQANRRPARQERAECGA